MNNLFNTVLIPPISIANAVIKFAQENFASNHMGYCLGSDGHLPHITLAQSTIDDKKTVKKLDAQICDLNWFGGNLIQFGEYYHHIDRGYCGISIHLSKALKKIHGDIIKIHKNFNTKIHGNIGEDYWPHFTFAKTSHQIIEPISLPSLLQNQSNGWTLEFGHMGKHGVYLGRYKS